MLKTHDLNSKCLWSISCLCYVFVTFIDSRFRASAAACAIALSLSKRKSFALSQPQPDKKVVVKINVFESISERKVYDVAL